MTGPTGDTVVRREVDLRLVLGAARDLRVPASFDYDPREPFAVRATFATSDGDVTWVFARDLLQDGLQHPAGTGDVAVWPSRTHGRSVVCLALSSPSGQALLEAERADVEDFVRRTFLLVAPGEEAALLDMDAAIAALLEADGDLSGG